MSPAFRSGHVAVAAMTAAAGNMRHMHRKACPLSAAIMLPILVLMLHQSPGRPGAAIHDISPCIAGAGLASMRVYLMAAV